MIVWVIKRWNRCEKIKTLFNVFFSVSWNLSIRYMYTDNSRKIFLVLCIVFCNPRYLYTSMKKKLPLKISPVFIMKVYVLLLHTQKVVFFSFHFVSRIFKGCFFKTWRSTNAEVRYFLCEFSSCNLFKNTYLLLYVFTFFFKAETYIL